MHRFLLCSALACLCGGAVATSAQLLNTHAGLGAPSAEGGGLSIAYVSSGDLTNNGGASNTLSQAYTGVNNSANELLAILIVGDTITGGNDDITSVTYNGVPATLAAKYTSPPVSAGTRYMYVYTLMNPAIGSHDVVITAASAHYLLGVVGEYSGVNTIPVDTTTTNGAAAVSLSTNITTAAANEWVIVCAQAGGSIPASGSNTTLRLGTTEFNNPTLLDTNGPVPMGTASININSMDGTASEEEVILVAIAHG